MAGDPATRRPGDPATRRPGDPATRRPGDPATRRPGDPATRRPGDPATRRPGDPATRRPGDPATRRPGLIILSGHSAAVVNPNRDIDMTPGPGPTPRTAVVTSVQTLCNRPVMTISHVSEGESGARARPPGIPVPAFRICTGIAHPAKDPVRRRAHRVRRSARVRAGRRTRRPVERPSRTRTHAHHRCGGARGRPARPPPAARTGVARAAMPSAVRAAGFASPDRARRAHGRLPRAPADGAERAPARDLRGPLAQARGRRDALRAAFGQRGLGGGSARLPPVTAPAGVAGADWCERGSDRRPKRPSGQWRQGDC